jgi:hypothetical protein
VPRVTAFRCRRSQRDESGPSRPTWRRIDNASRKKSSLSPASWAQSASCARGAPVGGETPRGLPETPGGRERGVTPNGRGGIRTLGTLLTYTHFPGVRLKPLGHPSRGWHRRHRAGLTGRLGLATLPRSGRATDDALRRGPAGAWCHGQGGIRTHGTVAGTPVFETGSFSHSDTCPKQTRRIFARLGGVNETGAARRSPARARSTPLPTPRQ